MSSRRGVFLVLFLFTLLGVAVLYAAWNLRGASRMPASDVVLTYDVPFVIEESPRPTRALIPWAISRGPYLPDIVSAIDRAANDDHVRALVLQIDLIDWGWARTTELRDAVQAFRASGKPVIAQLAGGGDMEYFLGSAADFITLPPQARLHMDGLSASALFLGGTLDKLGIEPNFIQAGVYKSAPEEYTRTGMSPAAREALDRVLDDLYGLLVDSLATARELQPAEVVELLDAGPFTAQQAWEAGLVDTLMHDADLDTLLEDALGEAVETLDLED